MSDARPYVILVLQGGGARGAYQVGVRRALAAQGLEPDWVCGISSGALNAGVIATNPPEDRDRRLLDLWSDIGPMVPPPTGLPEPLQTRVRSLAALQNLSGQRGFFTRRPGAPSLHPPGSPGATSLFSNAPLVRTLRRRCRFDEYNALPHDRRTRLSLGACDVESGQLVFFDSMTTPLDAEHVVASGSLPPGSAAVPIDGRLYWDGGVAANSPLNHILDSIEHDAALRGRSILIVSVDLWSSEGTAPQDLASAYWRQQQIQFSSRSYAALRMFERDLELIALRALVKATGGLVDGSAREFLPSVMIVHLEHGRSHDLLPLGPLDFSAQTVSKRIEEGDAETAAALADSDYAAELAKGGVTVRMYREGEPFGATWSLASPATAIAATLATAAQSRDLALAVADAASPPAPPIAEDEVIGRYRADWGEGSFDVVAGPTRSPVWSFRVGLDGAPPVALPGAPAHPIAAAPARGGVLVFDDATGAAGWTFYFPHALPKAGNTASGWWRAADGTEGGFILTPK